MSVSAFLQVPEEIHTVHTENTLLAVNKSLGLLWLLFGSMWTSVVKFLKIFTFVSTSNFPYRQDKSSSKVLPVVSP